MKVDKNDAFTWDVDTIDAIPLELNVTIDTIWTKAMKDKEHYSLVGRMQYQIESLNQNSMMVQIWWLMQNRWEAQKIVW